MPDDRKEVTEFLQGIDPKHYPEIRRMLEQLHIQQKEEEEETALIRRRQEQQEDHTGPHGQSTAKGGSG